MVLERGIFRARARRRFDAGALVRQAGGQHGFAPLGDQVLVGPLVADFEQARQPRAHDGDGGRRAAHLDQKLPAADRLGAGGDCAGLERSGRAGGGPAGIRPAQQRAPRQEGERDPGRAGRAGCAGGDVDIAADEDDRHGDDQPGDQARHEARRAGQGRAPALQDGEQDGARHDADGEKQRQRREVLEGLGGRVGGAQVQIVDNLDHRLDAVDDDVAGQDARQPVEEIVHDQGQTGLVGQV